MERRNYRVTRDGWIAGTLRYKGEELTLTDAQAKYLDNVAPADKRAAPAALAVADTGEDKDAGQDEASAPRRKGKRS